MSKDYVHALQHKCGCKCKELAAHMTKMKSLHFYFFTKYKILGDYRNDWNLELKYSTALNSILN